MENRLKELILEYGNPSMGTIPEDTWDTLNPDPTLVDKLLIEPSRSIKTPLYHTKVSKGMFKPILEEYVPYIQGMILQRYSKLTSYKDTKERLEALGYNVTSIGQLSNIFNRAETIMGLKDKRRAAQKRSQDPDKKRLVSDDQREHLKKARKIKNTKAEIARLDKDKKNAKLKLARATAKFGGTSKDLQNDLKEVNGKPKGSKGTPPKDAKVLYEPTPKQAEFHAAGETIVLYGGAAGGGKSYSMLMDALRYCMHGDYRALIIRKTSPMLKELIGVSRVLYPKAFPGAKYNKQESVWYFPSGATIEFGYMDKPEDLERYQGLPYAYIGWDEIQHQRTPEGFNYLLSRLRSTNPEITCYVRASANPGGAAWVKEYFLDPADPDTTFWNKGISWKFIPAKLEDNPYLDTADAEGGKSAYRKMLESLPEVQRKQLLDGDWFVGDDQMFLFTPAIHVIKEDPPLHWNRIRSMDYGYRDPAATLWGAISPSNDIYIYDEHEAIGKVAEEWARQVMAKERADNGMFGINAPLEEVIDESLFKMTGHTGPSIREQLYKTGMRPRPADRNREAGWNQIHTRLLLQDTGFPTIFIHERCVKLIDQLNGARVHPKKPEELDETRVMSMGRKHHWDLLDALRYLCMARPSTMSFSDRSLNFKQGSMDDTWAKFGVF